MKLRWSDNAIDRLRSCIETIAENSDKTTTAKWLQGLHNTVNLLETFPAMGVVSRDPHLAKLNIREISYSNYRIFYIIHDADCRIISIANNRQNIESISDI